MKCSRLWSIILNNVLALCAVATLSAQAPSSPTARLVSASRFDLPARIDSSNPAVWTLIDGVQRLFVISSWGGVPVRTSGETLESLRSDGPVLFTSHPGHGVWIEAIIPADDGTWYAYFHHERSADSCGRPDRQLPRIGALRSADRGRTWDDLGIIIDAPPGTDACDSRNRFVLGGVGDVTAALDAESKDVYLYFSQYTREPSSQGVAVARLAWADRDQPVGKVTIWNNGAWLPDGLGTPLTRATQPFHDRSGTNDVFWGPSIHWNTYLEQYVMLLNRARDTEWHQEGIYIAFSPTLGDPAAWSAPQRLLAGGSWYPQVVGLEPGIGTDKIAGERARLFVSGRSNYFIEFEK